MAYPTRPERMSNLGDQARSYVEGGVVIGVNGDGCSPCTPGFPLIYETYKDNDTKCSLNLHLRAFLFKSTGLD